MKDTLTTPIGCAAFIAALTWITPHGPLYLAAALYGGVLLALLIAIAVAVFAGR